MFEKECDIRQIHDMFGTDLSLANLNWEFTELVELKLCRDLNLAQQIKQLIFHNDKSKYENVLTILCRIQASTPQSSDQCDHVTKHSIRCI